MDVIDSPISKKNYFETPTRPVGFKWGFISGMVGLILALALHLAGMTNMSSSWDWSKYLGTAITIFLTYKAFEQFKDAENEGFMTLGQAMSLTFWMNLVSGAITGLYMILYVAVLEPGFKQKAIDAALEQAAAKGQDVDQVEEGMKMMDWMFDPVPMAIMTMVFSIIFGLILGLIMGLIMRRDPPSPFAR